MKKTVSFFFSLFIGCCAFADEGMWMVNAISEALVQRMQADGCMLDGRDIYDADKISLKDAIVSLDFGCTGSMISDKGLLITNHHCAYSDVHALSTENHNYLEDGFWAFNQTEEVYIPGKKAYFLKKVIDVTEETERLMEEMENEGKPTGIRKISYLMEKRYSTQTGLEASLSSMWAGSRYYMALYQVFTDIRLVAAPPVSISAFGGDIDNWEWPQHKCDYAMYRIYAAPDGSPAPHADSNIPWKPYKWLNLSTEGYQPGSFAMVLGYPGRTDRYSSSEKVDYMLDVSLPITNKIRSEEMDIMMKWMESDPAIRLKYSDRFFSLSNVQENEEGLEQCCRRFQVVAKKQQMEKKELKDMESRQLIRNLSHKYQAIREAQKNTIYYRETLIRGTRLSVIASKLKNSKKTSLDMEKEYESLDMRLEKDLFRHSLIGYYENVDSTMWGPYQKELWKMFRKGRTEDYTALCNHLWTDSYMTVDDRIFKFFCDTNIKDFNEAVDKAQGEPGVAELGREYTKMLYRSRLERDELQYPDANSTMRLTFGKVSTFKRHGKPVPWQTWSEEILEKEDSTSYDFSLKPEWKSMLEGSHIPVNFITDNDITGGNSGSPVLNAKGEIIGLAFDGNKESLASDVWWVEGWTKCVCVDIRYVLWNLQNYAGMSRIAEELGLL